MRVCYAMLVLGQVWSTVDSLRQFGRSRFFSSLSRHPSKRNDDDFLCTAINQPAMTRYASYALRGANDTLPFMAPQVFNILSENPELGGSREGCPAVTSPNAGDDVSERAICPWVWKVNYNPHRIPSAVYEAKCLCKQRGHIECEPITVKLRVLYVKMGACDSVEEMEEREEHLTVGCTAVRSAFSRSPLASLTITTVDDITVPT